MDPLPPAVYVPVGSALVATIGVLWKAWRTEAAERVAERKADTDWKNNLLSETLSREDK